MALTLLQYEEVLGLLGRTVRLVDLLDARSPGYVEDVLRWLKEVETALENNHLPAVSQIASGRAALIGATRGVQSVDVVVIGRPTPRRLQEATASQVLNRSVDILHGVIAERQNAFQEAERICHQVLAVAQLKGWLGPDGTLPHQERVETLRARVASDPDLTNAYAGLLALVGPRDVLILLDRALVRAG